MTNIKELSCNWHSRTIVRGMGHAVQIKYVYILHLETPQQKQTLPETLVHRRLELSYSAFSLEDRGPLTAKLQGIAPVSSSYVSSFT